MGKWLFKWLRRIVVTLMAVSVLLYAGDWAVYKMRGSPQGSVTVSRMSSVPLKGNKTEFDYLGTSDEGCSVSIFPQDGESPCWQLRRNPIQTTAM
jgi:hypothetical protein